MISILLGSKRNASVVSETPIKVHCLITEVIRTKEIGDPEAAVVFHKFVVQVMAEKLSQLMSPVEILMR